MVIGGRPLGVFLRLAGVSDAIGLAEIIGMPANYELPELGAVVEGEVIGHAEHNHQVRIAMVGRRVGIVKEERRPKTYQGYEGVVRLHLVPCLGKEAPRQADRSRRSGLRQPYSEGVPVPQAPMRDASRERPTCCALKGSEMLPGVSLSHSDGPVHPRGSSKRTQNVLYVRRSSRETSRSSSRSPCPRTR